MNQQPEHKMHASPAPFISVCQIDSYTETAGHLAVINYATASHPFFQFMLGSKSKPTTSQPQTPQEVLWK